MFAIGFISFLLSILNFSQTDIEKHEFHVSKTLLEYKESDQALQVTLNIFIDDLELVLENRGVQKLFICTEQEAENSEEFIAQYLTEVLNIQINSETQNLEWIGKEPSDDLESVWCYFEIKNISKLESLQVQNSLLLETFDDQKNIIQIIGPNKKSGYFMFQKGNDSDSIVF